jgi:hypothetical protein
MRSGWEEWSHRADTSCNVDHGVSEAALEWVMAETGADAVDGVEPLAGGLTSALHCLRLRGSGGQHDVVLRQMTVEPWRSFAAELVCREAETQIELRATDVPAPQLVAVDPHGDRAGEPSLLMTRMPGRTRLTGFDLGRLAAMLVRIHSIHPVRQPRMFQLWTEPARWVVPPWAQDPIVFGRVCPDRRAGTQRAALLHAS